VAGDGCPGADSLRVELLGRLETDQEIRRALMEKQRDGRTPDSVDVERMVVVDTANTAWLRRVTARCGWPGRSLVGVEAANAAFLLVQHADRDTAFQARILPLLERAYAAGDADGQQVALLADRLAVARGERQLYGTQATLAGGRMVISPIADSAGVDARRARMGLPPLAVYVRLLDSLYTGRP
jgi:hypothetical protein